MGASGYHYPINTVNQSESLLLVFTLSDIDHCLTSPVPVGPHVGLIIIPLKIKIKIEKAACLCQGS